jgi:hypothetical protein
MKKEATAKCRGLRKNISDEKRVNPKIQRAKKKDLQQKRGNPKTRPRNHPKTRASAKPKIKQVRQFTEAGFTNLMIEGEGDAFRYGGLTI